MLEHANGSAPHIPKWVIRTGIPSIDGMFRISEHVLKDMRGGIGLPDLWTSTSLAVVGPQGAGKSVLAMHVAARYLADCHAASSGDPAELPRVCYVSTDMTYTAAAHMLRRFALDQPNARCIPFTDNQILTDEEGSLVIPEWLAGYRKNGAPTFARDLRLGLVECPADDPEVLAGYILSGRDESTGTANPAPSASIAFVDLASRTAGDDWAFVHRLLGVLPYPDDVRPRHLIVIDAIEGLETFGGDVDSFGESSGRRARIAKLMRLAIGKCHVVTIVEESTSEVGLPEEFVSDVVFRLKSSDEHGYLRRTLQIEKARGQSTVRGRHAYVIRSGRGSTTGNSPNYDDPEVFAPNDGGANPSSNGIGGASGDDTHPKAREHQSYVEMFPSLHYASRNLMAPLGAPSTAPRQRRDEGLPQRAGFGIEYLDEMLAEKGNSDALASDSRGLPCSSITALIGDAGTQKTGLGIAFLGQSYGRMAERLLDDVRAGEFDHLPDDTDYRALIEHRYERFAGVPILITTQNESSEALAEYFVRKLLPVPLPSRFSENLRMGLIEYITRRTICRRLEIHDMPSSVLFAIIQRALEAGQRMAIGGDANPLVPAGARLSGVAEQRFRDSWRIRMVIDDLSTIVDTYAQVKSDPLFLPFLIYHLRREGPTSLIIDTRAGRPDKATGEGFHTDLRALCDHRIYTWPVREFYGDHRVAVAAIPPIARDHRARVREIKRLVLRTGRDADPFVVEGRYGKGELFVDPVFELYAGLEENRPQLVPLEVRLYGETDACHDYARYLNEIFKRTFRADPGRGKDGDVVISEAAENYNLIRDGSYLKVDTRLEHTLLLQIDEFWRQGHSGDLEKKYLLEDVYWPQPSRPKLDVRDPFHTYRETPLAPRTRPFSKSKFFDSPECDVRKPEMSDIYNVDRVPFLWDFGFLACRTNAWESAGARNGELSSFWDWYRGNSTPPPKTFDWATFLKYACEVASLESSLRQEHVPAFDLAAPAGESISCLVLEMWLSEIMRTLTRVGSDLAKKLAADLGSRRWTQGELGLLHLLEPGARAKWVGVKEWPHFPGWSLELYKTWLLLVEALDLGTLSNLGARSGHGPEGSPALTAVAVRHWYKTACAVPDDLRDAIGPVHYGRLPGRFTTRGDWFLAIAPESRSYPLASRALDLLCSIRGNMRRLEEGVGLPTRRLIDPDGPQGVQDAASTFRTRLRLEGGKRAGKYLSYADILQMGPRGADAIGVPDDSRLGWLWRSGLRNYHRHALTWQSWLVRMGSDWAALKQAHSTHWQSGFDVYGMVDKAYKSATPPAKVSAFESVGVFSDACRELITELYLVDGDPHR